MNLKHYLQSMVAMRVASGMGKPGGYYGMEDFILDRGTDDVVKPLSKDQLAYLRSILDTPGWQFEVRECFANSQMAVIYDRENRLRYREGFAVGTTIPVLHAWVTIDGEAVADLTWRGLGDTEPFIQPGEGFEYRGIGVDTDVVHDRVFEEGWAGSFIDNWQSGFPLLQVPRLNPVPDDITKTVNAFNG